MVFAPKLIIHDQSRKLLNGFLAHPSHALLLHGPQGVGTYTIASAVAGTIHADSLITTLRPIDGKDITIDQVRQLYVETHSVETSPKIVIVDEADTMSHPAQNAFLKLLEEPPQNVIFIMLAHNMQLLLPTILSRVKCIELRPISPEPMIKFISSLTNDPTTQAQIAFLAPGLPAQAVRLTADHDILQTHAQLTRDARSFIEGETYDRLILVNSYAQQRDSAIAFVGMVGKLLVFMLHKQHVSPERLHTVSDVLDHLQENANVKLQLTQLSLSL